MKESPVLKAVCISCFSHCHDKTLHKSNVNEGSVYPGWSGEGGYSMTVERSERGEHEMASHILWSQEEESTGSAPLAFPLYSV